MTLLKKRHLKYFWKGLILLAGVSFIVGQIAIYLYAAQ